MIGARGTELVRWRRSGCCRARLLHVTLSPSGWRVIGDSWRLKAQEWRDIAGVGENVYALNLRRVDGVDQLLPLEFEQWPAVRFEVGCDDERTWLPLSVLAADCAEARRTRRRVDRALPCSGVT